MWVQATHKTEECRYLYKGENGAHEPMWDLCCALSKYLFEMLWESTWKCLCLWKLWLLIPLLQIYGVFSSLEFCIMLYRILRDFAILCCASIEKSEVILKYPTHRKQKYVNMVREECICYLSSFRERISFTK